MIEESKKGFVLDPVSIRRALPERIVLFGNVDSQILRFGTGREIREAVRRQARAGGHGPFVHINGSPICPGTPPDSIRAFLDAARTT
jgi:uroporphyrinogen-III decarboxylase